MLKAGQDVTHPDLYKYKGFTTNLDCKPLEIGVYGLEIILGFLIIKGK